MIDSATILSPAAQDFLKHLHSNFEMNRRELLQVRVLRREKKLEFLPETAKIRTDQWRVADAPADLNDRRVEITGPAEAKMIINALNCGAKVFMADFEDSLSPTWENVIEGQVALAKAVRRQLEFTNEAGKTYKLNDKLATLVVRPRGLHLLEENYKIEDQPMSGSLFDFGLYFFHNAKELINRKSGPYFYLPKLESHHEAAWWNSVFNSAQDYLGIPRGTIRATVLIETIPAAFEMDEILFALKDHAAGLNAGRWDYIFSMIKRFQLDPAHVFPDRAQVTMTTDFLNAYCFLLVQTCHKRGAHAMGGMSAYIPNRKEPDATEVAMHAVTADKRREAEMGFDGTWIAHPDLLPIAQEQFDKVLKDNPNQKSAVSRNNITASSLIDTKISGSTITEGGVRNNVSVALQYIDKWLTGTGAVAINNLMEDAATAEISRSQLWQWMNTKSKTKDGQHISADWVQQVCDEEFKKLKVSAQAYDVLRKLIFSPKFEDFLTTLAYPLLKRDRSTGAPPL